MATTKKRTRKSGNEQLAEMRPADLSVPATITGTSGTVYRATDLLTEWTTRQQNDAAACLEPVIPVIHGLLRSWQEGFRADDGADLEAIGKVEFAAVLQQIDLVDVFNDLVLNQLDIRLLAILFLPEGARAYHAETVENRMEDFLDLTTAEKFEAFKRFFTSAFSSSPAAFLGASQKMLKQTSSPAKKR